MSLRTIVLSLGLALLAPAYGESVAIPVGQQGERSEISVPASGITMAEVEERYGAPTQKNAPVGDPPITSWRYDQYTVYFEHNRVIHSVLHR